MFGLTMRCFIKADSNIVCYIHLLYTSVDRCALRARARTYLTTPLSVFGSKDTRILVLDHIEIVNVFSCHPSIYNYCYTWDIDTADVPLLAVAAVVLLRSQNTNRT